MSGPSKKPDKKKVVKKKSSNFSRDVTINDFANSSSIHNRMKKTSINDSLSLDSEEKEIHRKFRRKQPSTSISQPDDGGIDYPLDLWFLISEYISPEAVGKFSSICKSTYHVVKTGKFWFSLYKRYYKPHVKNLPERLKPECMVRIHGLRACVIRSLHFLYFPYLEKSNSFGNQEPSEPHSLIKRRCVLMWHKKGENRWYFFFKLKDISKSKKILEEEDEENNDMYNLINVFKDVSVNSEENCQVLRVACLKYAMIPLINGLILQSVKLELSPGFDHHRLHLNFGTSYIPKIPTQNVILSGVVDCKVLNWWHPHYPHEDKDLNILLPSAESWDSHKFLDSSSYFEDESSSTPPLLHS